MKGLIPFLVMGLAVAFYRAGVRRRRTSSANDKGRLRKRPRT